VILFDRLDTTLPDPDTVHGPLEAAPVVGVFRLLSFEKAKGKRKAPPRRRPPPASVRPLVEPDSTECHLQAYKQCPPRVTRRDGLNSDIDERDGPILHNPTYMASTADNAYRYQQENTLEYFQEQGRGPEECRPGDLQGPSAQITQATTSPHDATALRSS